MVINRLKAAPSLSYFIEICPQVVGEHLGFDDILKIISSRSFIHGCGKGIVGQNRLCIAEVLPIFLIRQMPALVFEVHIQSGAFKSYSPSAFSRQALDSSNMEALPFLVFGKDIPP